MHKIPTLQDIPVPLAILDTAFGDETLFEEPQTPIDAKNSLASLQEFLWKLEIDSDEGRSLVKRRSHDLRISTALITR